MAGASRRTNVRGLRHIRTLRDVKAERRAPAPSAPSTPGKPPAPSGRSTKVSLSLAPAEAPPRTWVFLEQPQFRRLHHARPGTSMVVDALQAPGVDVFHEGTRVVVLLDLSGARDEHVTLDLHDDLLVVEAHVPAKDGGPPRRFYGEVLLPFAAHPEPVSRNFNNGMLELHLSPRHEPPTNHEPEGSRRTDP